MQTWKEGFGLEFLCLAHLKPSGSDMLVVLCIIYNILQQWGQTAEQEVYV